MYLFRKQYLAFMYLFRQLVVWRSALPMFWCNQTGVRHLTRCQRCTEYMLIRSKAA